MLGLVTLGNEDSDDDDVPLFNPADMGKLQQKTKTSFDIQKLPKVAGQDKMNQEELNLKLQEA